MTAIATIEQNRSNLSKLLETMRPQLKMALPRHLTPERMVRVVMTAWSKTPKLQQCSPMSVLASVVQAAQLGLEPDSVLGYGYLVPYYNNKTGQTECQFQTGYKGLLDLARRSGRVEAIDSDIVFARDHFKFRKGLHPVLDHVPSDEEDRGELTHGWAIAHFKGGGHQIEVMSKSEIEKVHRLSKAADNGPWVTHYEAMARKTVLRRLCKFLPLSPEIQRQISQEEMADAGIIESTIIDGAVPVAPAIEAEPKSKTEKVADKLGAAKPNGEPSPTFDQLQASIKDSLDKQIDGCQDSDSIQDVRDKATQALSAGSVDQEWYDGFLDRTTKKARSLRSKSKKKEQAAFAGVEAGPYANGA